MARRPAPLPAQVADRAFAITPDGVTATRLRAKDLHAPFAGVRAAHPPAMKALELVGDYLPRLHDGQFFSHATAALLHGMWLPLAVEQQLVVHVSVHKPRRAPRGVRVRGHHLIPRPGIVEVRDGIPASDPVETWCQLATMLGLRDLVIAGDGLVAKGVADAQIVLERMRSAVGDEHRPRVDLLRRAIVLVRAGSRSPGESRTRLVLVEAGLPEPSLNYELVHDGRVVAEGDLVYPEQRIWMEYEGEDHRLDRTRFRADIHRYEWLQDLNWRVVRVTADDLVLRPGVLVHRVRRLLAG